ncbi:hypothetical protein DL93DRAFT_2123539 [Clavulina sp. PMI_390]|nr:hypothetical protein DL93DRAFT_2123539 [Clavulina sp. PMI_390]
MNAQRPQGVQQQNTQPKPKNQKRSSSVSQQQSLNHLLNFSLPPRVQHVQATPRRSKKSQHVVWNPERFINAQYRFVMRPTGDYTVHFADPDIYLQWQDILQVIIARAPPEEDDLSSSSGLATCPICLSPHTAPRMTKCGHVFCYPCILHYIETGNTPKWHRCPICFDSITASQLKSVRWARSPSASSPTPTPGQEIPMRLMQRPHITTLALPRSDTWQAESQAGSDLLQPHEAPFHFLPDVEEFARFMLAVPEQLILDITSEIDDLDREERSLSAMDDDLGVTFVSRAREKCLNALLKAQEMEQEASVRLQIERKRGLLRDVIALSDARRRRETAALSSVTPSPILPATGTVVVAPSASPTLPIQQTAPPASRNNRPKPRNLNPPPHSSSSYYFYQAASGSNVFLHPLDIRILLAHFGSYPSFPNDITVRVTYASESTVDDDLRRRCKYLAHIPEGADVVFLEVDLENVVGAETLKQFDNLLKVRRTRHKERSRKEDKARQRAEERERDIVLSSLAAPIAVTHISAPNDWQWESLPVPGQTSSSPLLEGISSTANANDMDDSVPTPTPRVSPTTNTGVWGARSFASAAQSAASSPLSGRNGSAAAVMRPRLRDEDEWEIDQAWHELEEAQMKVGGGRGKRGGRQKKLVLLGSGAGGRRL